MDLPPDLAAQAIEFELATIREIIASETGISISELTPTLAFSDIGIDSLLSLTIIDRIREYIEIEIDRSFFIRNGTLEEVYTALNMGNWRRAFSERGGHASYAVGGTGGAGADSSRTLAIECWVWGTSGPQIGRSLQESRCDSECKVSRIEYRDIQKYLSDGNPDTPGPRRNSELKASMRIVLRKQKSSLADPFWDNGVTVNLLNEALGCPANHEYLTKHDAGVCGRFMTATRKPVYIYHRSSNNSTISAALRYDPSSNSTIGYVFSGPDITEESVRNAIQTQFTSCPHPLLLPTVVGELTAQELMRKLALVHKDLAIIEDKTGYGDWKSQVGDKNKHDCRLMARELGALSSRFAFIEVAIQCTVTSTKFTLQELGRMKDFLPEPRSNQMVELTRSLEDRLRFLLSNLEHMQLFAGINHRMQAQQNVLFNLIAQQDNALNIDIARGSRELAAASKRDSSDMKIIAVLTTIFLPGTFIAALFATPFFNWSAATMTGVMNDRLWVYWAVTGPLTVVTMGVVTVFAVMQKRKKDLDMDTARTGTLAGIV